MAPGFEVPASSQITPKLAERMARLGVVTVRDLLYLAPLRYADFRQVLPIQQPEIKEFIEQLTAANIEFDKRFVYYLLASTGICVVPLTSFFTNMPGFRMTLLEKDEEKFAHNIRTIADKIVEYIESSNKQSVNAMVGP